MAWTVTIHRAARKRIGKLPLRVQNSLRLLISEIELDGPVRGNWPNYSKLAEYEHHCHLKKGHPTYVAVWREIPDGIQLIEVVYAGTHEDAPY